MVLTGVNGLPDSLIKDMDSDFNFEANSRRVRLETLAECIRSAVKFLEAGGVTKPKNKQGKTLAIQDCSLNILIEVAVDCGWLKSDKGKFSHALRESRNVVHPWIHVTTRANFDECDVHYLMGSAQGIR